MLEAALDAGRRLALVATFAPTIPSMTAELQALARARGVEVAITPLFVPGAMKALDGGDGAEHDRLDRRGGAAARRSRRRPARPVLDGAGRARGFGGGRRQSADQSRDRGREAAPPGGGSRIVNRRRFLAAGSTLALAACAGPGVRAEAEPGFAEVNGTRLYYEVAGSGDPVVLVHAFTLDTRMWNDQFEALAREFRVIRYDARGFGKSARAEAGRAVLERRRSRGAPRPPRRAPGPRRGTVDGRAVRARLRGNVSRRLAVARGDRRRDRRLAVVAGVAPAYAPIVEAGRASATWRPRSRCGSGCRSSRRRARNRRSMRA